MATGKPIATFQRIHSSLRSPKHQITKIYVKGSAKTQPNIKSNNSKAAILNVRRKLSPKILNSGNTLTLHLSFFRLALNIA